MFLEDHDTRFEHPLQASPLPHLAEQGGRVGLQVPLLHLAEQCSMVCTTCEHSVHLLGGWAGAAVISLSTQASLLQVGRPLSKPQEGASVCDPNHWPQAMVIGAGPWPLPVLLLFLWLLLATPRQSVHEARWLLPLTQLVKTHR